MGRTDGEDPFDDVQRLDSFLGVGPFAEIFRCDVLIARDGQLGFFHERRHLLDNEVIDV